MAKEDLFKLIRAEDVVLWAGAGLSKYAGYPMGMELANHIFAELTKEEKKEISTNYDLGKISEIFVRLREGDRSYLNKILNKHFIEFIPSTISTHEKLASIPHFKTIITTNYDTLIEATNSRVQVLKTSADLPNISNNRVQLFKVHGDLSDPQSIILTHSDYANFFADTTENKAFWNVIKERLSTKSILFIGYTIEDINVLAIFDRIAKEIGCNRKPCYFVAPNLLTHQKAFLTQRGMIYIDSTGEDIINDLVVNINENLISDLEKGLTSSDTFKNYTLDRELIAQIEPGSDSNFKLKSLKGVDGDMEATWKLTFKPGDSVLEDLFSHLKGETFDEVIILKEALIEALLQSKGIKLQDQTNIHHIKITPTPIFKGEVDIRFLNGGYHERVPVELFVSPTHFQINVNYYTMKFYLNSSIVVEGSSDVSIGYVHDDICSKVSDEIRIFSLMTDIGNGGNIQIYPADGREINLKLPEFKDILNGIVGFLEYFTTLQKVEDLYRVRFANFNIDEVTEENYYAAQTLIEAGNSPIIIDWNKVSKIKVGKLNKEQVMFYNSPDFASSMIEVATTPITISLHKHVFNLGQKRIQILEPVVINKDKIEENQDVEIFLKSNISKAKIVYPDKQNQAQSS